MKEFARRIAVVVGAAALSAGLFAATAIPVDASFAPSAKDSSWGY
jgi:hypothetical protein